MAHGKRRIHAPELGKRVPRRMLRSAVARVAVIATLGLLALPASLAATHLPKKTNAHKVTVKESNYQYSPAHLTWTVGEKVRLTLKNTSDQPSAVHGFVLGKGVEKKSGSAKGHPAGWKTYLFSSDGKVAWGEGKKIALLQPGTTPDRVVLKPGGQVVMQFVVPNKPGTWHFASFQKNDYQNGMKGTVTIKGKGGGS